MISKFFEKTINCTVLPYHSIHYSLYLEFFRELLIAQHYTIPFYYYTIFIIHFIALSKFFKTNCIVLPYHSIIPPPALSEFFRKLLIVYHYTILLYCYIHYLLYYTIGSYDPTHHSPPRPCKTHSKRKISTP